MSLKRPFYSRRPIASVHALALALGISTLVLKRTARTADRNYRGPISIKKAGGKPREVFSATSTLRDVQQRILDRILKQTAYPDYLVGGLQGCSYIDNARLHSRSKILIGQDVDSFYPTITRRQVADVFRYVFRFPSDVSDLLSKLLTRCGVLVQGGVASTHVANLALHRTEAGLEQCLRLRGLRYSRYVDDIHVSAKHRIEPAEVTEVVCLVRRSLERNGFKPKRTKQFVATSGGPMQVHRLNVNSRASTANRHRRALRNEVFLLERWANMEPWNPAMERCFLRLSSRLGHLRQLNGGEARRLSKRLKKLSPSRERYLTAPVTTSGIKLERMRAA